MAGAGAGGGVTLHEVPPAVREPWDPPEFGPGQDFHVDLPASWQPTDWSQLGERPPVQPTMSGIVYPGLRHLFSGPPEAAKTWAAFAVALEQLRSDKTATIVHVDFEMYAYETRDRLRLMGATTEQINRVLHYEPETPANPEILGALCEQHSPSLVIIDAAAGAYALQGLDDNKRGEVELFARSFVDPFRRQGVATIILDHVVKNAEGRGMFSIGSERKVGGTDVHLGFEPVVPFGRGRIGLVKIRTHKDRGAYLPRPHAAELELRSDRDTHAVTWEFRPVAGESGDGDPWQPTALMEKVSTFLEQAGPEGVSRNNVESYVTGKRDYLRRAMDELVAGGYAVELHGPNRTRLITFNHAFVPGSPLAPGSPPVRPGEPLGGVRPGSPPAPFRGANGANPNAAGADNENGSVRPGWDAEEAEWRQQLADSIEEEP